MYGGARPQLRQHSRGGCGQWAVERAPAGALMTATAKALGDSGHIQLAFAAQAHAKAASRKLAKEHRYFDILDGERVVHQPFTIFFFGMTAFHLLLAH